jgi:hypothetical protein
MDIPIDPALLDEDRVAEENDLEDAEGELVDESAELMYTGYEGYGGHDRVEDPRLVQVCFDPLHLSPLFFP